MFIDPNDIVAQLPISGDETIIDLGCGTGVYSILLGKKVASTGGKVYAVDVQQDMLTRLAHTVAEENLSDVSCVHADIEKLNGVPLRDGIAQFALLSNALFCAKEENRSVILEEAARLLSNHGRLLVIDWTGPHKGIGPEKEQVIDKEHGVLLAQSAGFESIAELNGGAYHWAVLFDKHPASESKKHFAV